MAVHLGSKRDAVLEILDGNPDAKPKEISEICKKKYNLEVSTAYAAGIKSKEKRFLEEMRTPRPHEIAAAQAPPKPTMADLDENYQRAKRTITNIALSIGIDEVAEIVEELKKECDNW